MSEFLRRNKISSIVVSLLIIIATYVGITYMSLDFTYFWDNIQYSSMTAHWYYSNDFSSLILPFYTEDLKIIGAGGVSFMGLTTAMLWNICGKHLWVSHIYILFWALILVYNTFKLLPSLLPKAYIPFAMPVLLLESAILGQIAIASIDIVLLALFVTALRSVFQKKYGLLTLSSFLLIILSGRGLITGLGILLFSLIHNWVQEKDKPSFRFLVIKALPFIPGFLFFISFFLYNRWLGNNIDSPWTETWEQPESIYLVIKNIIVFGLRLAENGRFIIWVAFFGFLYFGVKHKMIKTYLQDYNMTFMLVFVFFVMVYLYYAITTKMMISTRYYMPLFFILSILVFRLFASFSSMRIVKGFTVITLFFQLTGHLWVYPEKVAQAWDASLAHIPYYELRNDCLNYIERNGIDFLEVSSGFCFAGNQRHIDLKNRDLYISGNTDNRYFIYSNISNLPDDFIEEINNPYSWEKVVSFKKGFIFVSLYHNLNYNGIK